MKKKKIVFIIGQLDIGGIESWLYDFVKKTHKQNEYTFIVDKKHVGFYEPDLVKLGCKVIHIASSKNKAAYTWGLLKVLSSNNFDISHSHVSFTNGLVAFLAALCRIPKRISHSHSNRTSEVKNKKLLKKTAIKIQILMANLFSTHRIAVSDESAKCHYNSINSVEIIPCGKDFSPILDFKKIYTPDEFGFKDEDIILGTVGRLEVVKNHVFLIDLLANLKNKNTKLFIIGDGTQYHQLQRKITESELTDRVFILRGTTDVLRIMRDVMHLFLFPSHHEGLGLAAIEAQAAGLPVITSKNVPGAVDITDNIWHLETESTNDWIEKVEVLISQLRMYSKKHVPDEIINSHFSIDHNVNKISRIYNEK